MNDQKRGKKEGGYAARQFGAEYQANPGSSRREYLDSAAWYYGKELFSDLTADEAKSCIENFNAGIQAEKKLQ